jgi:hypothetical protein
MANPPDTLGRAPGGVKASQIRGTPSYPVQHLSPCQMSEGIRWQVHPDYGLTFGLIVNLSGVISLEPVMVHKMRMKSFRVFLKFDAFAEEARFQFTLFYYDKNEQIHAQQSDAISAAEDVFCFNIPLEHIRQEHTFVCSLKVDLLTPLTGESRRASQEAGIEEPHHPLLLRAQWLEIKA